MNEIISTILKRRSIRAYLEKQICDEELDILLKTALFAPTGGDHQYTRFIAIQNPKVLEELNKIVKDEFSSREIFEGVYQNKTIIKAKKENYNFIFHAPTLIIIVSKKDHLNSMADSANAAQNIQIAATSLGLGACWINQLHWLPDLEVLRKYLYNYGLQEEENIFASVAVGYPAFYPEPRTERKVGRTMIIK